METVPKRYAISRANRYMLSLASYLIAYAKEVAGTSREFVKAAQRKDGLHVENLAEK